jgi:hypothetical protein
MREIAPRLHHWAAPHPGWEPDPEPESPADWPEAVGSVLFEAPDAVVFIDPQVPEELWESLDALVAGRPVAVLTTMRFHGRSRDAVLARYGGEQVRFDAPMPEGVEAFGFPRFDETIYWLPEPRALVPGDRLIGDGNGGARLCPESWLGYIKPPVRVDELRAALAPLGELPVEHLLLSHGAPVVGGGGEALSRALAV